MGNIFNITLEWIIASPYISLIIGLAIAEFITRITPTEKDDGFVQRLGGLIKFILDTVKTPNIVKKNDIEL